MTSKLFCKGNTIYVTKPIISQNCNHRDSNRCIPAYIKINVIPIAWHRLHLKQRKRTGDSLNFQICFTLLIKEIVTIFYMREMAATDTLR